MQQFVLVSARIRATCAVHSSAGSTVAAQELTVAVFSLGKLLQHNVVHLCVRAHSSEL
jgi:hypothetical protein